MDPSAPPSSLVPLDTTLDAYAAQTAAYRRMGGRERSAVMFRLNEMARQTAVAGIRSRHPEYTDEEVNLALFRLLFGDVLTTSVWPDKRLLAP